MSLTRAIIRAVLSWAAAAFAVWLALGPLSSDPDNGALVVAAIGIAAGGSYPLAHNIHIRIHWALWLKYNRH